MGWVGAFQSHFILLALIFQASPYLIRLPCSVIETGFEVTNSETAGVLVVITAVISDSAYNKYKLYQHNDSIITGWLDNYWQYCNRPGWHSDVFHRCNVSARAVSLCIARHGVSNSIRMEIGAACTSFAACGLPLGSFRLMRIAAPEEIRRIDEATQTKIIFCEILLSSF
jgi:hypothetical protein